MATVGYMVGQVLMTISGNKPTRDLPVDRRQVKFILDFCTARAISKSTEDAKKARIYGGRGMDDTVLYSTHTVLLEPYEGIRRGKLPFMPFNVPDYYDGIAAVYGVNEYNGRTTLLSHGTIDSVFLNQGVPFAGPEYLKEGEYLLVYRAPMLESVRVKMAGGDGSIMSATSYEEAEGMEYPCPANLVGIVISMAEAWLKSSLGILEDVSNNNQKNLTAPRVQYVQQPQSTAD